MLAFRWILGVVLALVGGGFVILTIVAGDFRRSFGASPVSTVLALGPLVAMVLLLMALIAPTQRPLLHAGAIAATLLVGVALWQLIAESATVMWCVLLYLAFWFLFYVRTLFPTTS